VSYATVPAYHVFKAAEARIEGLKSAMNARTAQMTPVAARLRRWLGGDRRNRALRELNMADARLGMEVSELLTLSCAATSTGLQAMMALDQRSLRLPRPCSFDPRLTEEVKEHMAFAAAPGGTA
jgi:hypothetical protein